MRKWLLVSVLALTGCDVQSTSDAIGELVGVECNNNGCNAVIYSEGVLGSYSVFNIPTCKEDYSRLVNTKILVVRHPAEVPIIQKTETAIHQCNRIYPFKGES